MIPKLPISDKWFFATRRDRKWTILSEYPIFDSFWDAANRLYALKQENTIDVDVQVISLHTCIRELTPDAPMEA
jgi:hypothetical protein